MSQTTISRYGEDIEKNFPYTVNYPRTTEWYGTKGDWYQLASWCDSMIGKDNWEYTCGPVFRFRKSKDQAWFMLRWA